MDRRALASRTSVVVAIGTVTTASCSESDIMNVDTRLKDLVTGVIILAAVALAAVGNRRR